MRLVRREYARRGFGAIEALIAVSILGALVFLSTTSLRPLSRAIDLTTSARQLVVQLDRARELTLGSEGASQFGIHFQSDKYVMFTGATYSSSDPNNVDFVLDPSLELYAISVGAGDDVVFDRLSGTTTDAGTVGIRLIQDTSHNETIQVLSSGQVDFSGSTTPIDSRTTDARHVHFDLGWSIQGTTTMLLTFTDSPGPNVVETIVMSEFFDVGETVFDWSGTVDVNGEEQVLRIHSHSIGLGDTVLSITRDERYNSKAVTVEIDGDDIVSYDDTGVPTVGVFGGVMTIQ